MALSSSSVVAPSAMACSRALIWLVHSFRESVKAVTNLILGGVGFLLRPGFRVRRRLGCRLLGAGGRLFGNWWLFGSRRCRGCGRLAWCGLRLDGGRGCACRALAGILSGLLSGVLRGVLRGLLSMARRHKRQHEREGCGDSKQVSPQPKRHCQSASFAGLGGPDPASP